MKIWMITANGATSQDTETFGRRPVFPAIGRRTVMATGFMFHRGDGRGLKMSPGASLHFTMVAGPSSKAVGVGCPDRSQFGQSIHRRWLPSWEEAASVWVLALEAASDGSP